MTDDNPMVRDNSKFYIPAAIVLAGGLIGAGILLGLILRSQPADRVAVEQDVLLTKDAIAARIENKGGTVAFLDTQNIRGSQERFMGNKNAPLTMTYWFDYQCPFCQRFEKTVMPTLVERYVNTGKIKIIFRDFAFLGNDSLEAAQYAHAVWDLYPERFFAWHNAMVDVQDEEGDRGFGDAASIDTLNSLISGIDAEAVKARVAMEQKNYELAIDDDRKAADSHQIHGTPAFVVGAKTIIGAQPLSAFESLIDSQLQ